eukprot:scaffold1505_cov146-Skeletonema_marinoi.AAC.12
MRKNILSLAIGRKRNQGKARKAAKAKAREEATESNNQVTNQQRQSLAAQMQQLEIGNGNSTKCWHGFEKMNKISRDITANFVEAFQACFQRGSNGILNKLIAAGNATI